ncbi:MAG: lysophospholipid acyltransferase family protein [Planctomycetota bacterium]
MASPDIEIGASPFSLEHFEKVGPLNRLLFFFVRVFGTAVMYVCFRYVARSRPRLEDGQPYIIAANHISFLDPPALQAAFRRRIFYLMTERIYRQPAVGWFFRFCRVIPVRQGSMNRQSLVAARKLLSRGQVVGIFPEGGISRSGELRRGHPGIASLVLETRVPVIPAAIFGTRNALPAGSLLPRPKAVRVVFGEPLNFDDLPEVQDRAARRVQLREVTERIMTKIAELQTHA